MGLFGKDKKKEAPKKRPPDEDLWATPSGWDEAMQPPFPPFQGCEDNLERMRDGIEVERYQECKSSSEQVYLQLHDAPDGKGHPLKVTFCLMKRLETTVNVKFKRTLWIVDIEELLPKQATEGFKKHLGEHGDPETKMRSLSVRYDIPRKQEGGLLEVVFPPDERNPEKSTEFQVWFWTLQWLKVSVKHHYQINPFPTTLDKFWTLGDQDGGGTLEKDEVFTVVKKGLNLDMKEKKKNDLFNKSDRKGEGALDREGFERLMWQVKQHDICKKLWRQYATGVTRMRPVQLGAFLKAEQGEKGSLTSDIAALEGIFHELTGSVGGMDERMWNIYLTQSALNDALLDDAQAPFQPMDRAWPDYYVKFAAHIPKQPLTEEDAWSLTKPEAIIPSLLDQNYKGFHMKLFGPVKADGETVGFIGDPKGRKEDFCALDAALMSFKEGAFGGGQSKYPIILLFEVCCKDKDQTECIKKIKEILGFRLKDSLQAQVIKCPAKGLESFMIGAYPGEGSQLTPQWDELTFFKAVRYQASPETTKKRAKMQPASAGSNPFIMVMNWDNVNAQCESEAKWRAFRRFAWDYVCAYVPSDMGHNRDSRKELQTGAQGQKVEVDVKWDDGVRTSSAFGAGVQLVGVNMHLCDADSHKENKKAAIAVAAGYFELNGNQGWTRKPKTKQVVPLVNPNSVSVLEAPKKKKRVKPGAIEEEDEGPDFKTGSWKLTLTIISAHQLPNNQDFDCADWFYDMTDPQVQVRVDGLRFHQSHSSRVVPDNGFNPTWDEEWSVDIPDVEECVITFSVIESDIMSEQVLAMRSLPVACLAQGYRCIPLKDKKGKDISEGPTLFVKIRFVQQGNIVELLEKEEGARRRIKAKQAQLQEVNREMLKQRDKLRRIQKTTKDEKKSKEEISKELKSLEQKRTECGGFTIFLNGDAWADLVFSIFPFCAPPREKTEEELEAERLEAAENKMAVRVAAPPDREERQRRRENREDRREAEEHSRSQAGTALARSHAAETRRQSRVSRRHSAATVRSGDGAAPALGDYHQDQLDSYSMATGASPDGMARLQQRRASRRGSVLSSGAPSRRDPLDMSPPPVRRSRGVPTQHAAAAPPPLTGGAEPPRPGPPVEELWASPQRSVARSRGSTDYGHGRRRLSRDGRRRSSDPPTERQSVASERSHHRRRSREPQWDHG
eukprot:TRINITY_DN12462_c0_g1_i1.p1 TRINITY_DN12462_c0_g1~~TRINITY_DN12462_c0_g1_i1.p1  ORF type:complete len:1180 (+),score=426.80 TRINITY_DN12462_c0_g1_i1:116-3655(+)